MQVNKDQNLNSKKKEEKKRKEKERKEKNKKTKERIPLLAEFLIKWQFNSKGYCGTFVDVNNAPPLYVATKINNKKREKKKRIKDKRNIYI